MPKVALVAHWDWVLSHYRMPIANGLRDAGCEVVMVSPDGPYTEIFRKQGFRWVEWPVRRRSINPLREIPALRRLTDIYCTETFDAVHHFTIKPNLYGTIAARRARIPAALNMFSGLGFVFSDAVKAMPLRTLLLPIMRRAFAQPGAWVLALNDADLKRLRDSGLATVERSRIMPEGVDTDAYRPPKRPRSSSGRPTTVILACRLLRTKGVPELVAAARILKGRGVDVRIQIAGEPDLGNPESVTRDELRGWQREDVVELLGPRDDMPELLRAADVAILPTHYKEGLPRFLLEAGACQLPLVATDIPGCRDIVRDGVNGYLIPRRDPLAIADVVERLAADPDLRVRLGQTSQRIVVEEFSQRRVVEKHLDLYREIGVISEGTDSAPGNDPGAGR